VIFLVAILQMNSCYIAFFLVFEVVLKNSHLIPCVKYVGKLVEEEKSGKNRVRSRLRNGGEVEFDI
jgi:hypothetical protein